MPIPTFPKLTTTRLNLRQPAPSDWQMISYLRSDKEVNKLVKRPSAETKEKALAFISKAKVDFKNEKLIYWVITLKDDNQMIGSICL